MEKSNCGWSRKNDLLGRYHDTEWGVPVRDDRMLFEHLTLEVMQCGQSWELVLRKREALRWAFSDFVPERIASYGGEEVARALAVPGMIRSRRKVEAVVGNARACLELQNAYGSFSRWLWSFSGGKMLVYAGHDHAMPASNELSERISREMKKAGFRYVGAVTVYSLLQACGMINDHDRDCPRFMEVMRGIETELIPCSK